MILRKFVSQKSGGPPMDSWLKQAIARVEAIKQKIRDVEKKMATGQKGKK